MIMNTIMIRIIIFIFILSFFATGFKQMMGRARWSLCIQVCQQPWRTICITRNPRPSDWRKYQKWAQHQDIHIGGGFDLGCMCGRGIRREIFPGLGVVGFQLYRVRAGRTYVRGVDYTTPLSGRKPVRLFHNWETMVIAAKDTLCIHMVSKRSTQRSMVLPRLRSPKRSLKLVTIIIIRSLAIRSKLL